MNGYQIVKSAVWRETDEGIVIVDPKSSKVRVLNGLGSLIWKSLSQEAKEAEIVEQITGLYDVSAEKAASDLQLFLTDLQGRGLVIVKGAP